MGATIGGSTTITNNTYNYTGMVLLEKVTADGTSTDLTTTADLSGYDYLYVVFRAAKAGGTGRVCQLRLNGVSANSYYVFRMDGTTNHNEAATGITLASSLTNNEGIVGEGVIFRKVQMGDGNQYKFVADVHATWSTNGVTWGGQLSTAGVNDVVTSISLHCETDNLTTKSEIAVYGIATA